MQQNNGLSEQWPRAEGRVSLAICWYGDEIDARVRVRACDTGQLHTYTHTLSRATANSWRPDPIED